MFSSSACPRPTKSRFAYLSPWILPRLALRLTVLLAPLAYIAIAPPCAWAQSSMDQVKALLVRASRFAYVADAAPTGAWKTRLVGDYWQLPEETEHLGRGDCEDKALWLYAKMLAEGFDDVRLVIGKYRQSATVFHAWVVWYPRIQGEDGAVEQRIYILDPTKHRGVWQAKQYPRGYYQPYYSFHRSQRWRHLRTPARSMAAVYR